MRIKDKFIEFDRKWRESFSGNLKDPIRRISAERHAWWMDHGLLRSLYDNEFEISKGIYRSNQPSPKKIEYCSINWEYRKWHVNINKGVL